MCRVLAAALRQGTGKSLGISHGIEETEQFNNDAFMNDITTFSQDNEGAQSLLNVVQEFEHAWRKNTSGPSTAQHGISSR